MSLSTQLKLSVLTILIIVFVSSMWINVSGTRGFVEAQLSSHSQDTATSLGLSIAPFIGNEGDLPIIDAMINAIFDRGYYQQISLYDGQQKLLLQKSNPESLEQVPDWFRNLFSLSPPLNQTEINDGWQIAGKLTVTSHPGIGYQKLWLSAVQSFWMTLGLFILASLMVFFLLRIVTRPIKDVVSQAEKISHGHFVPVEVIPKTRELRTFVTAMNTMSSVLGKMFRELSAQAERYRKFAYVDNLTGLSNRRAFELNLKQLLTDEEKHAEGYLFIIRLSSLTDINQTCGADDANQYIVEISSQIIARLDKKAISHRLYRISGADMGLIIENIDGTVASELCTELSQMFGQLIKPHYSQGTAHLGASHFELNDTFSGLIEKADSALVVAKTLTQGWQLAEKLDVKQSNSEWRTQLEQVLAGNKVTFVKQAIKSLTGNTQYHECYARFYMPNEEKPIPTGQLIPASERLNYVQAIDRLVISSALEKLHDQPADIGINVSRSSIADDNFCSWLVSQLQSNRLVCKHLAFEVNEHCLHDPSGNLLAVRNAIKESGARLTIEHFGTSSSAFSYLNKIKPDYIKLDSGFIRDIDQHQDNQFFVQALVNIAHGLNIQVIAEQVETALEANALQNLHVDCLQGYFIGKPGHW